jgi:hypothetical protein
MANNSKNRNYDHFTPISGQASALNKVQTLDGRDTAGIGGAGIKQSPIRFLKSFSFHLPFGTKEACTQAVASASLDRLTGLIKICGFLMQTKAYLFWRVAMRKKGVMGLFVRIVLLLWLCRSCR